MKNKLSISTTLSVAMASFSTVALANGYTEIGVGGSASWGEMQTPVETALGIIQIIGIAIGVAMVMYVGIKYLTSGAGKKAEAKETMVPVLIGAALLALAPTVIKWIFQMFIGTNG